jgi:nitrogen regulatory protein PII
MQLLVAVVNHEEKLDDLLAGFLQLGITGATIINSEGMGHVLTHQSPLFARVSVLGARSRPRNLTVFSVIEDDKLDRAVALVQSVLGDLSTPGAGIVFAVPVARVVGLAPELESEI